MSSPKFWGYIRPNGAVGVRNHLLILPATLYANDTCRRVAGTIQGAVVVTHPLGRAQVRPDLQLTFRTLVGSGRNSNVGGVVVIDHFREEGCTAEDIAHQISQTGKPIEVVNMRAAGGVINATAEATRKALQIQRQICDQRREEVPLRHLVLGLNCGTSDTTSGLSANVALGVCSDRVVAAGGRSILAEVTELMGAEDWLCSRAISAEVAEKIVATIQRTEARALEHGEDIRGSQPTGDNILGGLTTIEEKSLGAAKKGGTSAPIIDVLAYGEEPGSLPGLYIMDTPGQGGESITGIAAAGAQMLVFATGGGHAISHPIMPTIKVTGNPYSYAAMRDTVELDVSGILNGELSIAQAGEIILQELLASACGRLTKSEILRDETGFAIHRLGSSL